MPAEWARHERTLIAWPARAATWRDTSIEAAREVHAQVVAAVAAFEPVTLVVDPAHAADARRRVPTANVELLELPIDDSWLRDNGPIMLVGEDGADRAAVDFGFNAWGGKFAPYDRDAAAAAGMIAHLGLHRYEAPLILEGGSIAVDGDGTLVTTEQCLLNPNRNPALTPQQIEERLRSYLGAERIVWLGSGLVEDHDTDGHVDNICVFLAPGRALLQTVADAEDPNRGNAEENARRLRAAGIEVVPFELLPRTRRDDGDAIAIPYTNLYLCNDAAIVPLSQLDPELDEEALRRLRELMPDREVVGVPGRVLALGGGGVHCITQQVPLAA